MRRALLIACALTLAVTGCRRRPGTGPAAPPENLGPAFAGADVSAARRPPIPGWPRVMVVAPGEGPALYLGPGASDPAIGYLEPGIRVRVESAPVRDRVEVLVSGKLPARGWVPAARLGGHVRHRQRVEGTAAYIGSNDIVTLTARRGESYAASVRPRFRDGSVAGPFEATLPVAEIADRPFDEVDALTDGECFTLPPGEALTLYDRVGGDEVATLPATDPPLDVTVLRRQSIWFGVRAGQGPYLTGFVRGALTPCADRVTGPPVDGTPVWMSRESGRLFRVAAGTRVSFNGQTIARLRETGWARALGRMDLPMVDVFLSVDDDAAIRGLVPRGALTGAGAMNRGRLLPQLAPRLEAAQRCYRGLRAEAPRLRGHVTFRFVIEPDGTISESAVHENTSGSDALEGCLMEALEGLTFSPGPEGGPVAVQHTVAFTPPPVAPPEAEAEAQADEAPEALAP